MDIKSQSVYLPQSHPEAKTELVSKRHVFIKNLVGVLHLSLKVNLNVSKIKQLQLFVIDVTASSHLHHMLTYCRSSH